MAIAYTNNRALVVTFAGLGCTGSFIECMPIATSSNNLQPQSSVFRVGYFGMIARDNGIPVIDVADTSVSPVRGDPQQGTLHVEIVIPQEGVDYQNVLRYFAASSLKPACYALQDFGPTDIIIVVDPIELASSGIVAGSIIYWGREALLVNSIDLILGHINIQNDIPSGTRVSNGAVGVEGHFGTYIEYHYGEKEGQQPPYNDSRIYTQNPFLKDREVVVWQTNGVSTEEVHSRYYLESATWTNNQASLEIRCRDVLAVLADQQINSEVSTYEFPPEQTGFARWQTIPHPETTTSFMIKAKVFNPKCSVLSKCQAALVKFGDIVVWLTFGGPFDVDDLYQYRQVYLFASDGVRLTALNGAASIETVDTSGTITEIIATNPDFYLPNRLGVSSSPYFSTDLNGVATHPIDILRCHLGTIDSQLPDLWITRLPPSSIDDEALVRLRDEIYTSWEWRGIIQPCDGSSAGLMAWLTEKILRPIAASFTTNSNGQVTVRSLLDTSDTSLPEISDGHILAGRSVTYDMEIGVDSIRASTAIRVDGESSLQIFGTGAYQSSFGITRQPQIVDLQADGLVSIADYRNLGDSVIQRYAERLARIAALFRLRSQTVTLGVLMESNAQSGQYRMMRVRGLRDPNTGLIPSEPSLRVGYITAVSNEPRTGIARITAILYPFMPKRIGPSAVVVEKINAIRFGVATNEYIEPVIPSGPLTGAYVYAPSTNAFVKHDAETFWAITPQPVVVVRDKYLARIPGVSHAPLDSWTSGSPDLMELSPPGFGSYSPDVGDIITFCDDDERPPFDEFAYFTIDAFSL